MKPFKTKFQRVETKYILTKEQYAALQPIFNQYMEQNEFAHSTIANLYYDTHHYQMVRHSIEKPEYKEKIRIRSYEAIPTSHTQVFTEVKKKFQKIVYKRRIFSDLGSAIEFFEGNQDVLENSQVKNELLYMQNQYEKLVPKMYIYYNRFSLQAKEDESVRITLDSNLIYRDYDLDLTKGVYGNLLLPENVYLMEVKISGAYPLWLSQLLSENKIYKSSFSKYGAAYKMTKIQGGTEYVKLAI